MSTKEKFRQINKEALYTVYAVVAIIIFWTISGLGVSKTGIMIGNTPLWFLTGCLGTWIFASLLVWWMIGRVYKDFDLDEKEGKDEH